MEKRLSTIRNNASGKFAFVFVSSHNQTATFKVISCIGEFLSQQQMERLLFTSSAGLTN